MTRAQQDEITAALDTADVKVHQAVAELVDRLVAIERERRERIARVMQEQGGDGDG